MSILIITKKILSGGSNYEKNIANVLGKIFQTSIFELDRSKYKYLKFKILQYYAQLRFDSLAKTDCAIISTAALKSGISLKKYSKKILVFHHYDPEENGKSLFSRILHKFLIYKLREFDLIVVVSDYWKKYLEKHIRSEKIKIVYNSFDIDYIKTIIIKFDTLLFKEKYNIPQDKIIVYAGNSIPSKGILEVTKQLKGSDYHIITSGRKETECGNQHLILPYADYLRLLAISDVSVLLSTMLEGWNRSAHESLLCGTPVIGTDSAGLGELLKLSGQLIYNKNTELIGQIQEVLNNNMITKQGRIFAEQYDSKYFQNQWVSILKSTTHHKSH